MSSEQGARLPGKDYVLGLDYGSDSARAVLIDAATGETAGVSVRNYPRWAGGLFCDPAANRFRQHPRDYIDTLEETVREVLAGGEDLAGKVRGIAIDTTGSTPCAVDGEGTPLALKEEFAENPNAMFVLWKDHTAVAEAERITRTAKTWGGTDYTRYEGGVYSAEWFWAKVLRVITEDPAVAAAAYTFVEHCDWMTALLTGLTDPQRIRRSRCAMGHKAMYHRSFEGGYPSGDFLRLLDPRLVQIRETLGTETHTSDTPAGPLTEAWARRLGLPPGIPVAVGAYDAHMGAVGGGVRAGVLVQVMGTSTCAMIVGPIPEDGEVPVRGICGQVEGSIVPGMMGYEAGQSAFGDVYAWFKNILMWPLEQVLPALDLEEDVKGRVAGELSKKLIPALERAAERLDPRQTGLTALDWLNGRRTPDANQLLKGAVTGLSLGTDAVRFYRALVEATAFGARAIVERFREQGVAINELVGIGGVARKSSLVMRTLADVLNMPIKVSANDQTVALGAAMFAAVVAGLYPDIPAAQAALCPATEQTYVPDTKRVPVYDSLYKLYQNLGTFAETLV